MPRVEVHAFLVGGPLDGQGHFPQGTRTPPDRLTFTVADEANPFPPGRQVAYLLRGGTAALAYYDYEEQA